MDPEQALKLLYGKKGIRDLRPRKWQEALSKLRKESRALSHQVERSLDQVLKKNVFPRRARKWQVTSEGSRARIALLPHNPHVQQDVLAIRDVLGIPDDQIDSTGAEAVLPEISDLDEHVQNDFAQSLLANAWLVVHSLEAAGGMAPEDVQQLLPRPLADTAIGAAHMSLAATSSPDWLKKPPNDPPPYDGSGGPIHWAVGRLLERHRLPLQVATYLTIYVLTLNVSRITGLEHIPINVKLKIDPSGATDWFSVTISGLDEYTTREDWERLWLKYVVPEQERLWDLRGMKPHGKRGVDLPRLRRVVPLYRKMVTLGLELKEALVKDWSQVPGAEAISDVLESDDQAPIRDAVRDLRELLAPGE